MSTSINGSTPIKYVLLGDSETTKAIAEFSSGSINSTSKKQSLQIFQKICKTTTEKNFEGRNKITGKGENFYFKVDKPNLVFLVLADANYPERFIFQMIDDITEDKIPLMTDDIKKELNAQGRQALKAIVDKYQDVKNVNKIAAVQSDVDNLKTDLQKTISKQMDNVEDVRELESKSNTLKLNANDYKKNANDLRKLTFWQNFKFWIILISVIIILILVIVLPIVC